eukprot:15438299-Alexandrium_andersonii.AAC.1
MCSRLGSMGRRGRNPRVAASAGTAIDRAVRACAGPQDHPNRRAPGPNKAGLRELLAGPTSMQGAGPM